MQRYRYRSDGRIEPKRTLSEVANKKRSRGKPVKHAGNPHGQNHPQASNRDRGLILPTSCIYRYPLYAIELK